MSLDVRCRLFSIEHGYRCRSGFVVVAFRHNKQFRRLYCSCALISSRSALLSHSSSLSRWLSASFVWFASMAQDS